jgi:SAM-dependent methyltransferase
MDSSGLPEKVEDERRELPSGESALLQEMIQAQFHSDSGFEYYDEQGISEDEMIKSEYMKYPEENGRTYHAYKAGKYMFPNDESEQDRLDLQHHLFLLTFNSKLYLSPIIRTKKTHRVLDAGCGTGIWAIHFASQHPEAEVLGIDLSPIQPKWVPPNLRFETDDLEDHWTFKYKFDFIYSRMMTASFKNWLQFFANSFE